MEKITLDTASVEKLKNVTSRVALCDATGRVLGRFVPHFDVTEWEPVGLEASDEELDERAKSTEWYTTEEILAHLKSLESP